MEKVILAQDHRNAILSSEIDRFLRQGFHVISQTDTTAQMQKDKSFSCLLFLILLLLGILPGILYAILRRNKHAHISIDDYGHTTVKTDYNDLLSVIIMIVAVIISLAIISSIFNG